MAPDTETEREIQAALDRLTEGGAALVVAHRLATIRYADHIAVPSNGRIAEIGSYAELQPRGGLFARLAAARGAGPRVAAQGG